MLREATCQPIRADFERTVRKSASPGHCRRFRSSSGFQALSGLKYLLSFNFRAESEILRPVIVIPSNFETRKILVDIEKVDC
jgi:hypothetical protein